MILKNCISDVKNLLQLQLSLYVLALLFEGNILVKILDLYFF